MQRGKGTVYILTNPSFSSGVLKIGMTRRDAKVRAEELYDKITGVPEPFQIAHKVKVANCVAAEEIVHKRLDNYRINKKREFFKIPLIKAIELVNEVAESINMLYGSEVLENNNDKATSKPSVKITKKNIYKKASVRKKDNGYRSVKLIEILCESCLKEFQVTIKRYENIAFCSHCNHSNRIDSEW